MIREVGTVITFFPYLASLLILYGKISKTDEIKEIANKDNKAVKYSHIAIFVLFLVFVLFPVFYFVFVFAASADGFIFIIFTFIPTAIAILPFWVIIILQKYNLTKTAICAAVLETAFFWIFLFSPIYGALFGR
ncbi:MAG: hypothetical protein LBP54_02900 [Campylobacteraceae bacterium]|nr:hypothetical protein [Campylobacteraceae bacterium]